ncbi:hypothetical protein LZ554_002228 [Drepanopeziza brunnea f. sp. 'monogermtubi']|nr:hypothetical protein LZ554_002228 [Drepanopeziza brunnea f. sp. 'monogermtubi']
MSQQNDAKSHLPQPQHPQSRPTTSSSYVYSPNNPSPGSEPAQRSLRKAAPSPLQISTTATSPPSSVTPTKTTFARSAGDHSYTSPLSPKERLDDLLASEQSFYRSEDSSVESSLEQNRPRNPHASHSTNGSSRSVSDPVIISKPSGGPPPGVRTAMASSSAPRGDMAEGPPRTSSIDSAISSISGGHSKSGSQDFQAGSLDIANLIQAAGSSEAVIQYLLKEKASQTSQNSQLWRLVDKQRAMILGLNKDLERALRDKERYRKKLKESLAPISNPSPVDSTQGSGSEADSIASDTRPAEVEAGDVEAVVSARLRDQEQDQPPSPIDVVLASHPLTPPTLRLQTPAMQNMVEADHEMPPPTEHAFQQYSPDAPGPGFEAGQQQRKTNEGAGNVPYSASLPPPRSMASDPPRGPPPSVPPPRTPPSRQEFSVKLTESSPNSDDGLKSFPTPPRKAPPTPLDLGKKTMTSTHLGQASPGAGDDTDSDYDDILDVDELPSFTERGRRKTREEDDREREIASAKDAEIRSLSRDRGESTSKSGPATPKNGSFANVDDPMPTSTRLTVQISPPGAHMRHLSPQESNAGSLAGILVSHASVLVAPPMLSPGLPSSPRPVDRPMNSPIPRSLSNPSSTVNSPPVSPRGMAAFPRAVPLSPRAPRQPIPLPPNTPMSSIGSPESPRGTPLLLVSPQPLVVTKKSGNPSPPDRPAPVQQSPDSNSIYRGLVTEEYPDLLLPPNALPSIHVKVASSRLKPSRASIMFPRNVEEDPVFTLAVFARSDGRELWRVEKDSSSLANLDQSLKQSNNFTAKTPERSLFTGHAPAKVDARRTALDRYLEEILDTQMDTAPALQICKYLSTNTMAPNSDDMIPGGNSSSESPIKTGPGGRPLKNGYLTKRGKNFGGWKARYFVLDGPVFKYYDSPGGPHLGVIKLQHAQIGKQQQQAENNSPPRAEGEDVDNQYRHAFLILEPKRKDSSSLVRHVLCAESDQERDQWVEALLLYVDYKEEGDDDYVPTLKQHDRTDSRGSAQIGVKPKKKMYAAPGRSQTLPNLTEESLRGVSYENMKQGQVPSGPRLKDSDTPSPPTYGYEKDPMAQVPPSQSMKTISAPKNAQVIQDTSTWGNRPQNMLAPVTDVKQKKRSFFGFGSKPRPSYDDNGANDPNSNLSQLMYDQHGPIRPVFGSPLAEAVRYNHPVDVNIELPAVVYRCIEYLDAKNAAGEEGIFRLSGSNVLIKQLRERFNVEGDVNLVAEDQYYDIHAIASLLKLYLRELPNTILTRELHLDFVGVTELRVVKEKISALRGLVHRLPRANNALLRYLASFLINIINNADINKMTVRNVGIVFSPTLNIPAPVFALFLQQYDGIFGEEADDRDGPVELKVTATLPPYDQQPIPKSQPGFPQPQHYHQTPRSNSDTGLTPLPPTYESLGGAPTMAGPEYGRTQQQQQTLAGPSYDQFGGSSGYSRQQQQHGSDFQGSKSKRRESSMFGMNMGGMGLGPRKQSNSKMRDDFL